eukprot:sb/3476833/
MSSTSVVESDYLKRWVGAPLTEALTEVALKRPADPIEYIALWLLRYKENEIRKAEEKANNDRLAAEKKQLEEEERKRAELEEERKRIETENAAKKAEIEKALAEQAKKTEATS